MAPLHGALAAVSRLSGSRRLEARILKMLRRRYVRSRYGVTMRSNWTDATFNFCYFGQYGKALSNLLKTQAKPFVFLDIGANQGLYSLIAGKNPCCRAVVAFEPVPTTFALLETNVAANGLDEKVRPVNSAVAAENGSTVIRMDEHHSGGATMAGANDVHGNEITIHMIDHDRMDEIIPDGAEPIVAKIDVEGLEPVVVGELIQSRHRDRISTLFYEIDEQWVDPAAIEHVLRDVGFAHFRKVSDEPLATHYDVLAVR
jgi:FkbM family methyltransferase